MSMFSNYTVNYKEILKYYKEAPKYYDLEIDRIQKQTLTQPIWTDSRYANR